MEKKKNLGKGLAALFGDENEDYASLDKVRTTKNVPLDEIFPNEKQPRRIFEEEALEALTSSIRESGLLQPLVVRRHPERPSDYEIVAGERRWRASQRAGLRDVPVVIREFSDEEVLQVAIVENVQRQDLTAIEEAVSYRRLMDEFGHTQDEVAKVIGKSRSHIANMLRLLNLPEEVQHEVNEGRLSMGHARALVTAEDPTEIMSQVIGKGLSVRETEKLVKAWGKAQNANTDAGNKIKKAAPGITVSGNKDQDTLSLEKDLSSMLGLQVNIDFEGKGGVLSIKYDSLEQLDDLLHRLNQQ
ncbi:ParB/RepB/Spo0J family partition protein [Kiloniella sp. b19]|uniref:ParB/RepB/Spo0J family partition protein n=1 Tax=Kiloniella sp. GXU_MW_B19 TaxID=3141326 RepID=UPI0031DDFD13